MTTASATIGDQTRADEADETDPGEDDGAAEQAGRDKAVGHVERARAPIHVPTVGGRCGVDCDPFGPVED